MVGCEHGKKGITLDQSFIVARIFEVVANGGTRRQRLVDVVVRHRKVRGEVDGVQAILQGCEVSFPNEISSSGFVLVLKAGAVHDCNVRGRKNRRGVGRLGRGMLCCVHFVTVASSRLTSQANFQHRLQSCKPGFAHGHADKPRTHAYLCLTWHYDLRRHLLPTSELPLGLLLLLQLVRLLLLLRL